MSNKVGETFHIPESVTSMYWCLKCNNYRKHGSHKWKSCTKNSHEMTDADENFEADIKETRKKVNESVKLGMHDVAAMSKLVTLTAIKKTAVDPKPPADRASAILSDNIEKYSITADDAGRVYFWIRRGDESYNAFPHDSEKLVRYITLEYSNRFGQSVSPSAIKQAISEHTAKGDMPGNIIKHTGKRVIRVKDTVWIDLQDDENSIYKVTPDYCGPTVPYSPKLGILFDRGGGSEMPMPQRDESGTIWLDWFAEMLRIPEEKRMLFKVHVCHMVCMWQETPFMMFSGPEGSGKSVTAAMVKELIDPVGMNSTFDTLPTNDANNLAMMLTKEQTQLFDNISYISPQISDMLCRACTGGRHKTRELYTTNNILVYPFNKMRILFTGISKTTIRAPDLASRIPHYDVPPGQTDRSKNDLEREYFENRPYILHAVLNTISKAMKEYNARKDHYSSLPTRTRMADFERFGSAIAHVLGDRDCSSIRLYRDMMQESMSMMVADEPLIRLIEKVLDGSPNGEYYKPTATFFARIRELGETDDSIDINGKSFPKSTAVVTRKIDGLRGALLERGIEISTGRDRDKTDNNRQCSHITIKQLPSKTDLDQAGSTGSDPTDGIPPDGIPPDE